MEKIAILRWESGHVPQGLMQLEQLPGNSTNLASYPFPVKLVEVKGANTDTVILHPSQKLLEDMIQLAKELEKEGVRAITTSCGFNAIFQEALANAVDIPVFTSSLLQVPFAQALVGRDRAVGVITASASSLSEKHLRACGITDEMHPIVMGLENAPEWSKIFDHPDDSFDMDLVTEEILNVARQGVKDHPEIGAIVLECTDLPPFARRIREELDIPVFHDDQHGTAIVVTAALINALRVVGKKMEDVHIVLNGPGAAGTAIIKMLMTAGAKDIIAVDQFGTLYKGCNSAEAHKNWLGEMTNPRQIKGGLKEALEGADVFIGVSRPGILTTELCRTMNKDAIVFAMANPTPEIMPDEAKAGGVRVMATGRSDFPNQVNNVLCFPGLFKGALSVRARDINNEMKLAAAYAIADLITDADRSEENIIPGAFDPRVAEAVANAVAKAARETGVARL